MLTDLHHPEGGFYSAEDADSEGVEGKFYVWTLGELSDVLGEEDAAEAARFFGATRHGNFEGSNILYRPTSDPMTDRLEAISRRLLEVRAQRVRPGLDDKVVASWNGLALRVLAEAGAALADDRYLQAATDCGGFMVRNAIKDGTLMRSWRQGQARVPGFLEDYAALALGLFGLFAATGDVEWYQQAATLVASIPEPIRRPRRNPVRHGGRCRTVDQATERPGGQSAPFRQRPRRRGLAHTRLVYR